jgi:DNA-binding response OmpR family regulator
MIFGKRKRSITRLLVVEDEPLIAFDTEHFLSSEGYEIVATVDRVAEAVAVIESGAEVHLVLVDVSLADGSGMDVARAAKAAGVAVLFVTGNCPTQAAEVADGCLTKPHAQRDLLSAIEAIETRIDGGKAKKPPAGFRLFGEV